MITPELARRSEELADARVPFVTATVVRAQTPTSVDAGAVALVLSDGTIEGFVGGACAEHSVRAYSLLALESGEPVLLRILPDAVEGDVGVEGAEVAREPGAVTVHNPCLSGGAIEVFLEPAAPAPRVLVVGDTPIAGAVRRIARELGLEPVAVGSDGPTPETGDLALVVAAHGRDELRWLRRGLAAGVAYIGLVASEKRGVAVLDELRADGVPEELVARVDVPAGLALGARTPGETAVAILAKVVLVRSTEDAPRPASAPAPAAAAVAVDPVCGMRVAAIAGTLSLQRGGETFWFCSEGCKAQFEARQEHVGTAG